jgi:basic amino acid/polyamine antiporter, APA family
VVKKRLKRTLGLWKATIAGIGIILGAGIYAVIGVAAGSAGNALWIGFLIAGLVAGLSGLSYAELSSIFKRNAAEYDYVKKAFTKPIAFIVAIMILFAAIFVASAVALAFGGYFQSITGLSVFWVALGLLIVLTIINIKGIELSTTLNIVFTFIEAAGLVFIILLGLKHFGSVNYFEMPFGFSGVLQSTALVFFSFLGFESIVKLAEETKDPGKTIPKAILYSVAITTIVYVLVALSVVSIVDWKMLSTSLSPLADVAGSALGAYTFLIIAVVALFSTTNTVLMEMVTASRMIYGMAREKVLPKHWGLVNIKWQTPHYAILAVSFFSFIFLLFNNLERVASLANFFTFLTFAMVNLSVIVLRYTYKKKRLFRVPVSIGKLPLLPLLGGLLSLGMLYYVVLGIV